MERCETRATIKALRSDILFHLFLSHYILTHEKISKEMANPNTTLFTLTPATRNRDPQKGQKNDKKHYGNLIGSSAAIVIAELEKINATHCLLLVPDQQSALKFYYELEQFTEASIDLFPDWETLPYDNFSPHTDIISDRLAKLYHLPNKGAGITIAAVPSMLAYLAPNAFLAQNSLIIEIGNKLSLDALKRQLDGSGYRHTEQVLAHGEFACRGSIIDLFPMGCDEPLRIDFFDEEIDSIRTFDPQTQRTITKVDSVHLLPAHEFPTSKEAIDGFRRRWRQHFDISRAEESIYAQVSKGVYPAGIEYWQSLFFEQHDHLFNYLPKNAHLILLNDIESAIDSFWEEINYRYEQKRVDLTRPLLPPTNIWLKKDSFFKEIKNFSSTILTSAPIKEQQGRVNLATLPLPDLHVNHKLKQPFAPLEDFIKSFDGQIIFSVESEGRREALKELLQPLHLTLSFFDDFSAALSSNTPFALLIGSAENGFIYQSPNKTKNQKPIAFICENDLLGARIIQLKRRKKRQAEHYNAHDIVRNVTEIKIGQLVVHSEHGIGRYLGLESITAANSTAEYVALEYQNNAKLYVPVTTLNLISQYQGGASDQITLNRLGSDTWSKTRQKAAEKVKDIAAQLLDVYAKRELKPGVAFVLDKALYASFKAGFPFEETEDQASAIEAVLSDMCQEKAMDRLVCGDVGFGKTEVAMRAAFLATDNSKQVAVLVPTTLLAHQHFDSFRNRFANFPLRVEVLSRFKSAKEQKAIIADIGLGKVDIVIGTHKLLSDDISFADLGLLIVDEEHRFGVKQKEKMKSLRADIDILTLTATPIPRTLNMAMHKIRDLSIIATPPARRLPIKTFIREREDRIIREAVLREINRGGQVFFMHNHVDSIEKTADDLAKLLPEARIIVGHGQMRERELERIMDDFYHQRYNVLVCTTIIETGIDIPSANTIIIDKADHLGLSQLHQLRGRVGRSHHQAYAYLLAPNPKLMTKDAVKRLSAIASLEDLGSGFALASMDLDIRGAGELLGSEQSGQIQSIGFSLYMEMLDQAVDAMKNGKEPALEDLLKSQSEVDLKIPTLLPERYIPDVNIRLSLYKKIASANSEDGLMALKIELIDRFGSLPQEAENLFLLSKIKLKANQLKIKKLESGPKGGFVEFYPETQIDPMYLVQLLQSEPQRFSMDGPTRLKFAHPTTLSAHAGPEVRKMPHQERLNQLTFLLTAFAQHQLVEPSSKASF